MFKLFRFFIFALLFLTLQANGRNFNLPDKFDVIVKNHWWTENNQKPTDKDAVNEFNRPYTFKFNKNKFIFIDDKHLYSSDSSVNHYQATKGKGYISQGKLIGEFISQGFTYSIDNKLTFFWKMKERNIGKINYNGFAELTSKDIIVLECKIDGRTCDNTTLKDLKSFARDLKTHYLIQLPISKKLIKKKNTIEVSNKDRNTPIKEDEKLDKKKIYIKKIDNKDIKIEKTYSNPCRDPELKNQKEWKEYCANRAYNKKLDAQQEQEELEEEKAQRKADEEYERKLKKWEEETKAENEKLAKEFQKQRESWRKRDKKYDEQKNIKIAKKLKKKKEFQKQQELNLKLINKFTPGDEWSDAYARVKELDKNEDIEKSKKVYDAYKKIYYDSKQIEKQADAEYQNAKADEIEKKTKYLKNIKDTTLTINKAIAYVEPTGAGEKVVNVVEHTYSAIDGFEENGVTGATTKILDIHTNNIATDVVDTIKDYN